MVKLIGTNHLMKKEEIEDIIKKENPDIIGVELCNTRLNLMVINPQVNQIAQEQLKEEGLIDKISKKIKEKAEQENLQYGSDMINASKYAIENKIPLILVDMDILETKKLMEKIPTNELNFFMQELANLEVSDLTKEIKEEEVLNELKTKTPIAFEFLITLREMYIEKEILKSIIKYPNKKILIFLGKGHIKSMEEKLKEFKW